MFDVLRSHEDRSVNFVRKHGAGYLEARYVRRGEDYFMAYVSSHSGCKLACRFCHLTRTKQVSFEPASLEGYVDQVETVLEHHKSNETASDRMNVNYMARGEPLLNSVVSEGLHELHERVMTMAGDAKVSDVTHNVSSIFPKGTEGLDLAKSFNGLPVTLFWSLYSLDPSFRKRWLPKSIEPQLALSKLVDFQQKTGREVVLHWALIKGENDRDEDFHQIAEMVNGSGLSARLNMVRYNPADSGTGTEAPEERYQAALDIIGGAMKNAGSRVVPRVGFDVKASCGMFITPENA